MVSAAPATTANPSKKSATSSAAAPLAANAQPATRPGADPQSPPSTSPPAASTTIVPATLTKNHTLRLPSMILTMPATPSLTLTTLQPLTTHPSSLPPTFRQSTALLLPSKCRMLVSVGVKAILTVVRTQPIALARASTSPLVLKTKMTMEAGMCDLTLGLRKSWDWISKELCTPHTW